MAKDDTCPKIGERRSIADDRRNLAARSKPVRLDLSTNLVLIVRGLIVA